jgi:Phosphoglycerate dehydrogenase and related dehydrogenases
MTTSPRPEALILMGREAFETQFDAQRLDRLRALATVGTPLWTDDLDDPAFAERLASVQVLLTGWGAPRLTAERLDRMPRLAAMFHCAGTIRPYVTDEFWARGILASNVADANAIPVAEFTFAAIVMAGKKAPFLAATARDRLDTPTELDAFGRLGNLAPTIGVVGFSRIGRKVVQLVQQLEGVACLVSDPHADPLEVAAAGAELMELDDMLPRLDVLSLHAPELPSTRSMIGSTELAALPDHATVINTARGSLIDTAALERECVSGRLNAIIDVTEPEPLTASSVLYTLPNVMITPHIAGSLGSELYRLTEGALDELARFVRGEPLRAALSRDDLLLGA